MMKLATMLSIATVASVPLWGSALHVYQDAVFYDYKPQTPFIGLSDVKQAECAGEAVRLRQVSECEDGSTACRTFTKLVKLRLEKMRLTQESTAIASFEGALELKSIEPEKWFKQARRLAQHQTNLQKKTDRISHDLKVLESELSQETSARYPLKLAYHCTKELRLTLPGGAFRFHPLYRADITGDKIEVTQILEVTNRSGLDINATQADFYNAPAAPPIRLPYFWPETLSDEPPKLAMRRTMAVPKTLTKGISAPSESPRKASREGNRHYRIAPFELASTGEPKRFVLQSDAFEVKCRNEWAAYAQKSVYTVCRFNPTYEVENSLWRVSIDGVLRSTRAKGRYEEGSYTLYVMPLRRIKVQRRPYIPKKKEDGFFNTTVRKKDGDILTLINTETEPISVEVSTRIPVSTTEKIRVKLLPIKGVRNVRTDKQGKVTFDVTLNGFETKEITVLYEIDHDKATKVYRNR